MFQHFIKFFLRTLPNFNLIIKLSDFFDFSLFLFSTSLLDFDFWRRRQTTGDLHCLHRKVDTSARLASGAVSHHDSWTLKRAHL